MQLIVDTNIVYLFFSKDPFVRTFVLANKLKLYAPEQLFVELRKDKEKVCRITKIAPEAFDELYEAIVLRIIGRQEISAAHLKRAEELISDKADAPFLALALEMQLPIWSNDRHFKEQDCVPVYTVTELKTLFSPDRELGTQHGKLRRQL